MNNTRVDCLYTIAKPVESNWTNQLTLAGPNMDLAYDHILESSFPEEPSDSQSKEQKAVPQSTLNDDFQDAYRAFSSSPWGARLGGFFGNVVKQVCNLTTVAYPRHP